MADIKQVFSSSATPTDAFLVANCALMLEEIFAIKLDSGVRAAIASSAGWVHTSFAKSACGGEGSSGASLPGGDGGGELASLETPAVAALALRLTGLSSELAGMAADIAGIKLALASRQRARPAKDAAEGLPVADGGGKEPGSCYKYTGYQIIGSGVVSRTSIFTARATAGFSSLLGTFDAAGSLTVATDYNFRFMLAPATLNEGPSWDSAKGQWVIPWKDANGIDKEPVGPVVDRRCKPPDCQNDVVTGTAVALFDVAAAFYASANIAGTKLGSTAEIKAAVAGLTRTALVAPVTFTHASNAAEHQPLVRALPPLTP